MNCKVINNHIRTFFCVAISFLYLTVFENEIYESVSYSRASDLTNIEVLFQPELPKESQSYKDKSLLKQGKANGYFYLEKTFKSRKKLLLSVNNINNIYFKIQNKYSLPLHPIISILQKNNAWHQSSDDDNFPNDYC